MRRALPGRSGLLALLLLAPSAAAQSNADPAIDVRLGRLFDLQTKGRAGVFPNGRSGLALATTACNDGTVTVPWEQAMDPDHPFISFLVARDDGVRMQQISDRSYVKHGFFALTQSICTPCQGGDPFGTFLGIGCSDTYDADTNGDRFWLAPADEIDPWLGEWDPQCSYFDMGEASNPPFDCDGVRSLTFQQALGLPPVEHRVVVNDSDLIDSGGERFYYQAHYTVATEPEANRDDNTGWREVDPSFVANQWSFTHLSSLALGSVLEGWSGADVSSQTNGGDDGRVYVAVKVTGPVDGLWHYEYAVHNRDNARGVGALRIPVCADARIEQVGFSDVDRFGSNDWTFAHNGAELVWSTPDNPVRWNTVYNFWFDSDAEPVDAVGLTLDQFDPGAGAGAVVVASRAPLGLYNVATGPGCSNGTPPYLFATGTPPRATIGNSTFAMHAKGNAPVTFVAFVYGLQGALTDLGGGCFSYVSNGPPLFLKGAATDASGEAVLPLPIPFDPSFEGVEGHFQLLELDPLGGPFMTSWDLSDGLRVRVGDLIPSCP